VPQIEHNLKILSFIAFFERFAALAIRTLLWLSV
jgi:hypothetical protein